MSVYSLLMNVVCTISDQKRDQDLTIPDNIVTWRDICYGDAPGDENFLDIYIPKGTSAPLPVIVSVHGGGYVYGDKDLYQHYCMSLVQYGFAIVNFNYRLAPKNKFPAPLEDLNKVMIWIANNAETYHLDRNNTFLVGDSAGAQIAHQYAVFATNQDYAELFPFAPPHAIKVRALGLNCGMYDLIGVFSHLMKGLERDYLTKDPEKYGEQIQIRKYITPHFPPAYIMTAVNDFLCSKAQPLGDQLSSLGIENEVHIYGSADRKDIGHVFHLNMKLPEATQANTEECAFLRRYIHQNTH